LNNEGENASTWIATAYQGAAVPPSFNAPSDGQIGQNIFYSGSIKNRYEF
jgi:hypothetical protein